MAPRKNKLSKEEILQRKRESERIRYERNKNDPKKREEIKEKERLKYLKKKEKGTRKLAKDMTPRKHREVKKKWREHCSTYRNKKKALRDRTNLFLRENTPDSVVSNNQLEQPTPSGDETLKKKNNRAKKLRHKIMKRKDDEIENLKKKVSKYKKRLSRLKKKKENEKLKIETPNTKLQKMLDTPESKKELVKKALFGEVLKEQLQENFSQMKTIKEKQLLTKVVSGKVVDKYKLWRMGGAGISTYKRLNKAKVTCKPSRKNKLSDKCVAAVVNFYEDDSNSRLGAGRKEFITRKMLRKQKRYMLDSLRGLYKKFKQNSNFELSYQTFCRLRPFWVVMLKIDQRDTCLCLTHANIDLKLSALHSGKILNYNSHQKLLQELCCDRYNEQCLSRECQKCINNTPAYKEFVGKRLITYKKWVIEKQKFLDPKSKKTRQVTKYIKKSFTVQLRQLVKELNEDLKIFVSHERNIVHQFSVIKKLKSTLTEEDALIHMDFSENYLIKYGQEIQAFHFGGSRMQISLHTVVVYLKDSAKSYCTVSTNCSHSSAAIWAHLQTIFDALPPKIINLHFLSDGPVTQYRNKTMFYIMATKLPERFPNVRKFTWNYTESGHGKGAPDGIGATCKRTADAVVAAGGDIENLEKFIETIEKRCPAISLKTIQDDYIQEMSAKIEQEVTKSKPFAGTLKVHQVTGNFYDPSSDLKLSSVVLMMKHLSCFCNNNHCQHFNIGSICYGEKSKLTVDDVYTDSEHETEAEPSLTTRPLSPGDCVLVRYSLKNVEYRYVSIINQIDEEDGEIRVTFLKLYDNKSQTFRLVEDDVADVTINQVVEKLPNPNLILKEKRAFYKFDFHVDVFEK